MIRTVHVESLDKANRAHHRSVLYFLISRYSTPANLIFDLKVIYDKKCFRYTISSAREQITNNFLIKKYCYNYVD